MQGMIPAIISSVDNMLERCSYQEKKEIEVFKEFRVLASDVISKTAFGSNYLEGQEIFGMLIKLASILSANALKIKLPVIGKLTKSYDEREAEKLEKEIRESFIQIIRRRKEMKQTGKLNGCGSDYVDLLVNANQDNDQAKRISIDDMIDEFKTFYFAGHETTMSLLTWTMFLLAIHRLAR